MLKQMDLQGDLRGSVDLLPPPMASSDLASYLALTLGYESDPLLLNEYANVHLTAPQLAELTGFMVRSAARRATARGDTARTHQLRSIYHGTTCTCMCHTKLWF